VSPLRWLLGVWRTLTRSQHLDRDLHEEIHAYVDLTTAESVARGEDPAAARRRALAATGGVAQVEEAVRARRAGSWIAQALRDGRLGVRQLRHAPAFAVSAVLTLALAIGATAAMFTIVRAVVLAPLPFPESHRLVQLTGHGYVGEYLEYRDRGRTFDPAGYAPVAPLTLTGRGDPARLDTVTASVDLFDVLGAGPAIGRGWQARDAAPAAEPSVILSDRLWRERFGADPAAVGQVAVLDGVPRRVRGVMPADFAFPSAATGVWIPMTVDRADRIALWSRSGVIVGRLKSGVTMADATAEVQALAPAFAGLFPWRMPADYGSDAGVVLLRDELLGDADVMLSVAFAAVGFVLIIACLNVGVLLMGRTMARRVEMATRAALGASRARLARQMMAECAALAGLGGALGLAVAALAVTALAQSLPADVPRLHEVSPDRWLPAAVIVLTGLAAAVIGLVPVWRAAQPDIAPALGARSPGSDRATIAATRTLVAAEVALAAGLVVGAGLLMRSLDRLLEVDAGFQPAGVLSATVAPPPHRFADAPSRRAFYDETIARLEALPRVASAAVTDRLPFDSPPWGTVFSIEGRPDPATQSGDWPWADYRSTVSPAFFETIGIPVESGRGFAASDTATSGRVALVSAALAREYWPGEDPVGRRLRFPGMPAGLWISIVGTVADIKWERLNEAPRNALYLPMSQSEPDTMSLVVRAAGPEDGLAGDVRAIVHGLDADTPVDRVAPMASLVGASAGTPQFLAVLFTIFAMVGVALGAIGVYGVASDAVARRQHEIAVRLAIGAEAGAIVRLVVRQIAVAAGAGLVVGLAGALAGSRYLASLLFDVTPTDPVTFVAVPVALLVVVFLSCLVPARRATRVNPLAALRGSQR
jgi:putative ABC transport system permease protein